MSRFSYPVLLVFLSLSLGSGCGSERECQDDAECSSGQICHLSEGFCVTKPLGGLGSACDRDSECGGGTVCNVRARVCERPRDIDTGLPNSDAADAGRADVGEDPGDLQPRVVETVPADGSRGVIVGPGFGISVRFSEPVDETKVEAGFTLLEVGGSTVATEVDYAPASLTAIVRPTEPMATYGIYRLDVSTYITDFDEPTPRRLQESTLVFSVAPDVETAAHYRVKAAEYAPLIYQDTHPTKARSDYLTSYDFDEQWDGTRKQNNAIRVSAQLKAVVYYAVIESETHYFITYGYYHPFDYGDSTAEVWRENSLGGALVVAAKGGTRAGQVMLLETYSPQTRQLQPYASEGSGILTNQTVARGRNVVEFPLPEWLDHDGKRYHAYITQGSHDSCIWEEDRQEVLPYCRHAARTFKNSTGVIYSVGAAGEIPLGTDDPGCGEQCRPGERCRGGSCQGWNYELRSIGEALWSRRVEFGGEQLWASQFSYSYGGRRMNLPQTFKGDTSDASGPGEPPWAWHDPSSQGLNRGDYFLDPASALARRFQFPGDEAWSTDYCWNPFLSVDRRGEGTCAGR